MTHRRVVLLAFTALMGTIGWVMLVSGISTAYEWVQTDWSGQTGQWVWADTARYWESIGVNGWRIEGQLMLNAPNTEAWAEAGYLVDTYSTLCLCWDEANALYAGTSDNLKLGHVFKSADGGDSWTETAPLPGIPWMVRALVQTPEGLFAGTGYSTEGAVYRSTDGGATWDTTAPLTSVGRVNALLWSMTDRLYLGVVDTSGLDHGRVLYTIDSGMTWDSTATIPEAREVSLLGETRSGMLIAGTMTTDLRGRLFGSSDSGATWDTLGPKFPHPVHSLLADEPGRLYVGVGNAEQAAHVYVSTDGGETWDTTGTLKGALEVDALLRAADGTLYAGTLCEGMLGRVFESRDDGATWDTTGPMAGANAVFALLEARTGMLFGGTGLGTNNGRVFRAGFLPEGSLVSSVYDAGDSAHWAVISWSEEAQGESLVFQVRTGKDTAMSDAAPWDSCPAVGNGEDLSACSSVRDGDRCVQYRVSLSNTHAGRSPMLFDVQIAYTPTGIAAGPGSVPDFPRQTSLSISPNPVGSVELSVSFVLPRRQRIAIDLFDVSGRLLRSLLAGAYPAGAHRVTWADGTVPVGSGVYVLRLRGEEQEAYARMVVAR